MSAVGWVWVVMWGLSALLIPVAAAANPPEDGDATMQSVLDELARIREQLAIPETDQELMEGAYGLGPAASKVYGVRQGISLGGYGEFYFLAPLEQTEETGAIRTGDFYRFISYFGYKFNDRIVMNTEIEFEHATTGSNFAGKAGSVSVEFSYLDFLFNDNFNVRAGNLLVPVGVVNEMHEPPFYHGNFRPEIEQRLIPSTWRELGMGAHGNLGDRVRYTAYVVNGLNGAKFDEKGVRGGRQKGNRVLFEDVGGVLALNYDHDGEYGVGGSVYVGGADHNQILDDTDTQIDLSHSILEVHGHVKKQGLDVRAMFVKSSIDGAEEFTPIRYPDTVDENNDPVLSDQLVPESQMGFYVDVAYDIGPLLLGDESTTAIAPWVRYEAYNLHDGVPTLDNRNAKDSLDISTVTFGVDVKPHPQVVLKFDYVHKMDASDGPLSDEARIGAGFIY